MKTRPVADKPSLPAAVVPAALAALFLVLLCFPVVAQRTAPRRAKPHKTKAPTSGPLAQGSFEVRTSHIPPIILEDGSLTFETQRFGPRGASGHTPHQYLYGGGSFGRIYRVAVGYIALDGIAYYFPPYEFSTGGWEVRVSLEEKDNNDPEDFHYTLITPTPQIVIGEGRGVEIDKPTLDSDHPGTPEDKCESTGNPIRPCRFKHEPYHPDKHFRISQIEIRRGSQSMPSPVFPVDRQKVFLSVYYCHPGPQCH